MATPNIITTDDVIYILLPQIQYYKKTTVPIKCILLQHYNTLQKIMLSAEITASASIRLQVGHEVSKSPTYENGQWSWCFSPKTEPESTQLQYPDIRLYCENEYDIPTFFQVTYVSADRTIIEDHRPYDKIDLNFNGPIAWLDIYCCKEGTVKVYICGYLFQIVQVIPDKPARVYLQSETIAALFSPGSIDNITNTIRKLHTNDAPSDVIKHSVNISCLNDITMIPEPSCQLTSVVAAAYQAYNRHTLLPLY